MSDFIRILIQLRKFGKVTFLKQTIGILFICTIVRWMIEVNIPILIVCLNLNKFPVLPLQYT